MKGKVYLVGAGPGMRDLLTIRGREVIERAEVVLYDQLAGEIVSMIPAAAEKIDCGKYAGRHTLRQEEIERIMIDRAKAGRIVVRLKGGDPFLFGRGGEELEALRAAGVDVELVPGVTSAIAVPGCAGIPVTHRDCASILAIVTGHEDPAKGESRVQWDLLARMNGTIVVLMGVGQLGSIVESLLISGKDPATPVAIIERGLSARERVTVATLSRICEEAEKKGVRPPAVIVIGEVVRLYRGERLCGATE